MYRYEKILIYLNGHDDERAVLEAAAKVTHLAQSKQLTFTHFCDVQEVPSTLKEKYPWLMKPLDAVIEEKLKKHITMYYQGHPDTETHTRVEEGHPIYKLLEIANDESIDLIVVGGSPSNGDLPVRLARKAPCSVLVVPEKAEATLSHGLVAVDFSKYSEYSIDVGQAFARAQGQGAITAVHVSLLPEGRNRGILPESEYKEMNGAHYERKLNEFLEPFKEADVTVNGLVRHGYSVSRVVSDCVNESGTDFIIAGCRGKDALSSLLLGSNAESLVQGATVPVLAVKEKGTGKSFLNNLLGFAKR